MAQANARPEDMRRDGQGISGVLPGVSLLIIEAVLSGIVRCSLSSQCVSTTLGNGPTSLGVIFETIPRPGGGSREEVAAVKLLADAEDLDLLRRRVKRKPRLARDR